MQRNRKQRIKHIAVTFFIYPLVIPLMFLDICIEIYHQAAFRLCNIPLVSRSEYIRIDRHKLSYLPLHNKVNCAYCGYANGLLQYASRIAGDTEKYWCPIKHNTNHKKSFHEPPHHKSFIAYGDEASYKKSVESKQR